MNIFVIKRTFVRLLEEDRLDVTIDQSFPFGNYAFDSLEDAQRFCMDIGAKPIEDTEECLSYEDKIQFGGNFVFRYDIVSLSRVFF